MNREFRPHRGIKMPPPISDVDPSIALAVARQWERYRANDFVDLSAREAARQARIARWICRGERVRSLVRRLASFFGLSGSAISSAGSARRLGRQGGRREASCGTDVSVIPQRGNS